jgi:hypothetical protein
MSKFDLAKTQLLAELMAVAPDKRDEQWLQRFYAAVPDASLVAGNPQVEQGPDGFPYFQLAMPDPGEFTPFCVTHVLDNCLQHGMGIALFDNARRKGEPAWVFTYGSLLSFKLYGAFDGDPSEPRASSVAPEAASDESRKVLTGAPSESFLPAYARKAMGDFFRRALQHPDPRVALVVDPRLSPMRNLMVNVTLEDYGGDEKKMRGALYYLSWFLPSSYGLVAMPPDWKANGFIPLA